MYHGKGGAGGRENKVYPENMAGVNVNGTQADIAGKAGSKRPILAPLPRVMQHGVEGVGGAMQPFNSVPVRSIVAWDTAVAPDGLAHDDPPAVSKPNGVQRDDDDDSEGRNGMITGFQNLPSPHLDSNGAENWKASSVLENTSNLYASVISELGRPEPGKKGFYKERIIIVSPQSLTPKNFFRERPAQKRPPKLTITRQSPASERNPCFRITTNPSRNRTPTPSASCERLLSKRRSLMDKGDITPSQTPAPGYTRGPTVRWDDTQHHLDGNAQGLGGACLFLTDLRGDLKYLNRSVDCDDLYLKVVSFAPCIYLFT